MALTSVKYTLYERSLILMRTDLRRKAADQAVKTIAFSDLVPDIRSSMFVLGGMPSAAHVMFDEIVAPLEKWL